MPIKLIRNFIQLEAAGGILLFAAALLAITVDNSPLSVYYEHILETPLTVQFRQFGALQTFA